jgi:hypothetical protein
LRQAVITATIVITIITVTPKLRRVDSRAGPGLFQVRRCPERE